jgi:hypothetical protein
MMRNESNVFNTLSALRSWNLKATTTRVQTTVNKLLISIDYKGTIPHTTTLGHMELHPMVIKH